MSTPEAAMPAAASSHRPWRVTTRSCPPARMASSAIELTRKATAVMTIAPSTALIREAPSFRQVVQVAEDRPERIAKRMAPFTRRRYPESASASCPAPREAGHVPLVQRGEHLVDRGEGPDLEDGRLLHRAPVAQEALPRHLAALAPMAHLHRGGQVQRVIARRPLGVVVEVLEVPRVEGHDRDRLIRLPVPLAQKRVHEVRVGRLHRVRPWGAPHSLTVAREDAELERARLGEPPEDGDVAAAVRRPLLRDRENLGGTVRLRGEPPDRGDLIVAEPQILVPRGQATAPVHAHPPRPPAGLPREVLRRAHEVHVLLERHAAGEALRGQPVASGTGRHGQRAPTRWRPRRRSATPPSRVRTAWR